MQRKDTIWNKDFIILLIANAFVFTNMHMLTTTIADLALSLRANETVAGLLAGAFAITAIVVRPVCGNMIDRKSKKYLYIFSVAVILCSMLGYSVSSNNTMLFIFRLLHGVGWGFATTIGMTMATNTVPEHRIGEAASIYGLANVMAMAVAPTLGAFLSEHYNYRVMFLAGAALAGIAVAMLFFVEDQPPVEGAEKKKITASSLVLKEAVVPALVLVLVGAVYTSVSTFVRTYAREVGIANPAVFFTVYSVAILVVRLFAGRIVDKKGPEYIMVPAGVFFCGCLLTLARLNGVGLLYLAAVLMGLGYSADLSTLMAVSFKRTTKAQRGNASSTVNIGMDLGSLIGPTVAGGVKMAMGSYSGMYAVMCIPVVCATALFVWDQKQHKAGRGLYRKA